MICFCLISCKLTQNSRKFLVQGISKIVIFAFMKTGPLMAVLMLISVILMSVPFLVPHTGVLALFGLVPLLMMERIALLSGMKRFWWWHYSAFVLWNAATTFWVCNATLAGGIAAVLLNALQMSLVFAVFHWSRRRLSGVLPYILLAALWIAWERYYFTSAQISWPWLVLGNSFADTISLIQWYEYTGTLGGSLWIWAVNLGIFGMFVALSDGSWFRFNAKARAAAVSALILTLFAPMAVSGYIWHTYKETDDPLNVTILQPNFDPYQKFTSMPQAQQNVILMDLLDQAAPDTASRTLVLAPETFTSDIRLGSVTESPTFRLFTGHLANYPNASLIFGASTREFIQSPNRPSMTTYAVGEDLWLQNRNSAISVDHTGQYDIFHKSKLVVGVEKTPYPVIFVPLDERLGHIMGRDIGQDRISTLDCGGIPVGTAICYESVYGEYCTGYINAGARLLTVITNDAWWGNTPGYRQHLHYASLRAIETRRDIARCGNTGISAIIDQRGRILSRTPWWQPAYLNGTVNLNSAKTFFVRHGDIPGRLSVFVAILLLAAAIFRRRENI